MKSERRTPFISKKNYYETDLSLYDDDHTHPSYLGSCLAAPVHYVTLFGEVPELLDALKLSDSEKKSLLHILAM